MIVTYIGAELLGYDLGNESAVVFLRHRATDHTID